MRRNTIDYNGRTVILHDYAGLMLDEYAEAIRENIALAETEEITDRLVLIDATNTAVNKNVMKAYKAIAEKTRADIAKTAVVGATGVQKVFVSTIASLFKLEIRAFDSREDALIWLTD